MASPRPPPSYSNEGYMPNGATGGSGTAGSANSSSFPQNGRVYQSGSTRILCVADVRGHLRSLNDLAKQARADYIIHTGDFGFYDDSSLERIADKTLKHVAQYSPLLSETTKRAIQTMPPQQSNLKQRFPQDQLPLSELPMFLNKQYTLDVPIYTVWGACEDVRVLEKFRSQEYKVQNLHIIDEASSRLLDVGGIKLRLFGLGGAVVMHKLFDNGEGRTTIAGGQGTMWTTLLQMGELVDTANRVYDPTETRVFVTHASPAREGLLNQLSVTLKADFSVSAGLHFRYGSSYNEFSVNPTLDHYRGKLAASKASFNDVWETVKSEVEPAVSQNEAQQTLLTNALDIVQKMPTVANGGNPFGGSMPGQGAGGQVDESAFKNMWNFNLADAAFGYLVLEIEGGRIGTEMRAQGFNFAHRGTGNKQGMTQPIQGSVPSDSTNTVMQGGNNISATSATGLNQNRPPVAPLAQSSQQFNQNQQPHQQPRSQPPPVQRQQPPSTQPQQPTSQPSKTPTGPSTGAPRTTASPATVVPNQIKPATPQPAGTNANNSSSATQNGKAPTQPQTTDTRNGANSSDNPTVPSSTKPAPPVAEKKPSTGLFIHNMEKENEPAIREIFPEEDRNKIVRVEKHGKFHWVVHFNSHEETRAALERQPIDHKRHGPSGPNQVKKPMIKYFDDRGPKPFNQQQQRDGPSGQGAGSWQSSNRGGANTGQRGGYQSGQSDSEGGRGGRGGFNGRGRGGRGGERGSRGGRGGSRGSFNSKTASGGEDTSSSPTTTGPASKTPAPASSAAAAPSGDKP